MFFSFSFANLNNAAALETTLKSWFLSAFRVSFSIESCKVLMVVYRSVFFLSKFSYLTLSFRLCSDLTFSFLFSSKSCLYCWPANMQHFLNFGHLTLVMCSMGITYLGYATQDSNDCLSEGQEWHLFYLLGSHFPDLQHP